MAEDPKNPLNSQALYEQLTKGQSVRKPAESPASPSNGKSPDPAQQILSGVTVDLTPAPLGRRALALCIDLGIISGASYLAILVSIPIFAVIGGFSAAMSETLGKIMLVLIALVLVLGALIATHWFFIYFEEKRGATPGKKLLGLRVVSVKGGPITRRQAVIRELVRWYIDGLFGIPALISMSVTPLKQRVGDLMAETLVVYSAATEQDTQFLYVLQSDYNALLNALGSPNVTDDDAAGFLEFASKAFLTQQPLLEEVQSHWVKFARERVPKASELGVNDQTLLRFLAEYCHHLTRISK